VGKLAVTFNSMIDRIQNWRSELEEQVKVRTSELTAEVEERKQAQLNLQISEEHYRQLIQNLQTGIVVHAPDTRLELCNDVAVQLLDLPREQIIGKRASDHQWEFVREDNSVMPPEEYPVNRVISTRKPVSNMVAGISRPQREHRAWVLVNAYPVFSGTDELEQVVVSFVDITIRKQAEDALRKSEEKYRTFFEESTQAILIVHPEGRIIDANPSTWKLFGTTRSNIVGENIRRFCWNPEDRKIVRSKVYSEGLIREFEWKVKRADGTPRDCLLTSSLWKDEHGAVLGFLSIARDVTDSKRLEEQLLQAQKMEAVGTLAGGIAHDFNNLLQVIHGYADLGLLDIGTDQPGHSELVEIRKAAERAADLTQGLLTFSRRAHGQPKPVDLNRELMQMATMLERTIPKMIEIELKLAGDLREVKVDPGQMHQAVMNLAVNARDAMPGGGKLTIETANVFLDEEFCKLHIGTEPGYHVLLACSDTGFGMDKSVVKNIFDPFFTTKEVGKGTGLGLSIVFGIVKSHGGTITCYSESGEGTTFKIYLPVIKQPREHHGEARTESPTGGSETILLVDDEDSVRTLGESILRRFGYSVLTASSGHDALEIFRQHKTNISLVVLDLIMPEMGGRECLREILTIDPGAKVLIASGYGTNGQIETSVKEGARTAIRKPYETSQLLEAIRRVLDEPNT
jgi:two-component system cell cycle sensor histidine kinase/response regulator CckA